MIVNSKTYFPTFNKMQRVNSHVVIELRAKNASHNKTYCRSLVHFWSILLYICAILYYTMSTKTSSILLSNISIVYISNDLPILIMLSDVSQIAFSQWKYMILYQKKKNHISIFWIQFVPLILVIMPPAVAENTQKNTWRPMVVFADCYHRLLLKSFSKLLNHW